MLLCRCRHKTEWCLQCADLAIGQSQAIDFAFCTSQALPHAEENLLYCAGLKYVCTCQEGFAVNPLKLEECVQEVSRVLYFEALKYAKRKLDYLYHI